MNKNTKWLKSLATTFVMMLVAIPLKAQYTALLKDGSIVPGIFATQPTRNIIEVDDGLIVKYTIENATINKDSLFPNSLFWRIEGFGVNDVCTQGAYPYRTDSYTVPKGYSAQVTVLDSSFVDYDYCLAPARTPVIESKAVSSAEKTEPIKPFKSFCPSRLVNLESIDIYRGTGVAHVVLYPLQYNFEQKKIRAFSSISYKIAFVKENTTIRNMMSSSNISVDDHFLENTTINGYSNKNQRTVSGNAISDTHDYLILSCPKYGEAVSLFAEWKKTLGFNVHAVLKDQWTSESIKEEVQKVYDENPNLYYLLIVGNHEDLPGQYCHIKDEKDYEFRYTDLYYTCMDGEKDSIPDLYRGRLSVSSPTEAINVIEKIIQYEKNPTTDSSFYETGLNCAYFEDEDILGTPKAGYEDKRFIKTSEEVRDYLQSKQKNIKRVYFADYPKVNRAFPSYYNNDMYSFGEPLPDELKNSSIWKGNSDDIDEYINKGTFYVLYRGHGSESYWYRPFYQIVQNVNLNNENKYPVIFSLTCLTGRLDHGCFAEQILRKPKSGCVAIYAASDFSYSGYNDALCCGMFDAIWPDPGLRPRFKESTTFGDKTPVPTYELGQILSQGIARMKETFGKISNKFLKRTEEIFYCYGDPSMKIYTAVPKSFEKVKIERAENGVNVVLEESGKISFYNKYTGEVFSVKGTSANYSTAYSQNVSICISGHNKIPYIEEGDTKKISYIQNKILTGSNSFINDFVKIGSKVTSSQKEGPVIFQKGSTTISAKDVYLTPETTIEKGAEMNILTK